MGTAGTLLPVLDFKARVDHSLVWLPVYNVFLRFISGATPADLLMASMAVEPFLINVNVKFFPQNKRIGMEEYFG